MVVSRECHQRINQPAEDPARHNVADQAALKAGLEERRETFRPETLPGIPPVELRFFFKPGPPEQQQRLVVRTHAAMRRLSEWFGAFPSSQLTVIDTDWRSPWVGAAYPGTVVVASRWIAPERDGSLDRLLIGAIARQYWFGVIAQDPALGWFEEGLLQYVGGRVIDTELEGRQFWSSRYLGDFIPFPIRSLLLSPATADARPRLRQFDELERPAGAPWRRPASGGEVRRTATAFYTLERYLGWPALQQGLEAFRARYRSGGATPADLAAILSEQRGADLSWFFVEAFRFGAHFDYAIDRFTSVPDGAQHRISLQLRRHGEAVFAGTAAPRGAFPVRSLDVSIELGDGTRLREWWDGRDAALDLDYLSAAPAVRASVDPGAILLLDTVPSNNTRSLRRELHTEGVRATLSWVIWLQNIMLTWSGLV